MTSPTEEFNHPHITIIVVQHHQNTRYHHGFTWTNHLNTAKEDTKSWVNSVDKAASLENMDVSDMTGNVTMFFRDTVWLAELLQCSLIWFWRTLWNNSFETSYSNDLCCHLLMLWPHHVPGLVMEADTVVAFKGLLGRHIVMQGIEEWITCSQRG